MDSEEKLTHVPDVADMVREIRRKPPEEARALLATWLERVEGRGRFAGMREGLRRGRSGAKFWTLASLRGEWARRT